MKLLIVVCIALNLFAGVGDSAGGSSRTWQELYELKDNKYYIDFPIYKFDDGVSFAAHKICLEGNTVRSIKKYQKYDSVFQDSRMERRDWKKAEYDYSRRPIELPSDDNLRNDVKLVQDIEIRKLFKYGSNKNGFTYRPGKVLFTKTLEIKNCEEYDE